MCRHNVAKIKERNVMKNRIVFAVLAAGVMAGGGVALVAESVGAGEAREYRYDGCLPTKEGGDVVVFTNATIATLAKCTFEGTMCGAWVNEGKPKEVRGYNMDYREGERLSVQFQCSDYSIADKKGYVKCVRVVFTDSPEGVKAVCDYSGFVTLGYQGNAIGFKFNGAANWKAVDSADGKGYGMASVTATMNRVLKHGTSTPKGFGDNLDEAMAKAKENGKNVLVAFSASDLSVRCEHFTTNVLERAEFQEEITNAYELVFIDSPEDSALLSDHALKSNPEIRRRYGVWGYPSLLVLDGEGEIVARPYVTGEMEWEDVYLAIKAARSAAARALANNEARSARSAKMSVGDKVALAVFKALLEARIKIEINEIVSQVESNRMERIKRVKYPAASEAKVETEYFENVAIPFYNRHIVESFAADSAAGGKHHDEILDLRRKFAMSSALNRSEILTGADLDRAAKLWNKENVRDVVVGILYMRSLRAWEREVNKNWDRAMSECRKLAKGDAMMEMIVEYHNAFNGGENESRWADFDAAFKKVIPVFAEADDRLLARYARNGRSFSHETIDALPHPRMKAYALADLLMDEAFNSRGGGWAGQVTDEGRKGYSEKLADGVKCLKDALKDYPDDPFLLSRLAYFAGCSSAVEEDEIDLINAASRASLDFSTVKASEMLHFLTSRWGGSTDLLREFAIRAADDVRCDSMFAYKMAKFAIVKIREWEIEKVCPETFYSDCYTPELKEALFKMFDAYIAGERGPLMPDADFFRIAALELAIQVRDFDRAFAYAKAITRHPKGKWDYDWPDAGFDTYITAFSVCAFIDGKHMQRFVDAMRMADGGTIADRRRALEEYRAILAEPNGDDDEKAFVALELYRQRTLLDLAENDEADLTPTFEFGEADNIWAKPKDKGDGWIQWHSARHDLKLMSRVPYPYTGSVYSGEVKLSGDGAKFQFSPCRSYRNADSLNEMPFLTIEREGDTATIRLYSATAIPARRGRTRRLTWDDYIAAERKVPTKGLHTWEMDLGEPGGDFVVKVDGEEFCRIPYERMYSVTKEHGKHIAEGNWSYPVWTVRKDAFFRNPRITNHSLMGGQDEKQGK